MKCETARDRLEVTRPDRSDRNDPDLREEFAHLDSCEMCEEVYQQRQAFDRQIARAMRDVPTPDGLKSRILHALEEAGETAPDATVATEPDKPAPTRRTWLKAAGSLAAAVLIAAVVIPFLQDDEPQQIAFSGLVSDLGDRIASEDGLQLVTLEDYDGPAEVADIDGRWSVHAAAGPKGVDFDGDGAHDVAVYAVRTRSGRGAGFLVVAPLSRISQPPNDTSWIGTTPHGGPVQHVAWKSGEKLYICFNNPAAGGAIQDLLREVGGSAA